MLQLDEAPQGEYKPPMHQKRFSKIVGFFFAVLVLHATGQAGTYKFASQTLTVPDGFEIELVAAHPLVDRPIVASLDEQGAVYVADSSGSNEKVQVQLEKRPHRILKLVDTDGDSHYDKSSVFADKMMFPEGAMFLEGSLYVAAPPSIWKLTDTDGDGAADKREEWFQGKTLTGCANDLHGPYAGRDGWIYWAKGAFAEQTYQRGSHSPFVTKAAHLFRARPDGSGIEPVMTGGMDNPVEVAFTLSGERIFTTTFFQHPRGGKRDGLVHAIYGGVYGKDHEVLNGHKRTGDLMPLLTHFGAAAPSGLMTYESEVFGAEFRGNLFSAQFNKHKIQRHILRPDGATYKSVDSDFVTSDNNDFHPTDVLEDGDGSLLVVDTGGWYKLCCPTSQLPKPDVLGAIYRIRAKAMTPKPAGSMSDPFGKNVKWGSVDLQQMEALLDDPRPFVHRKAIEHLPALMASGDVFPTMRKWLRSMSPNGRRNLVWALTRSESPTARELVHLSMDDRDETVAVAAIHSASVARDASAFPFLITRLKHGTTQIQRASAEALGRLNLKQAVPYLLAAASSMTDRVLEHSITYALIELADNTATAQGLTSSEASIVRCSLIALDQMDGGGLEPSTVIPLLDSPKQLVREAASWIVEHRTDWGEALSKHFQALLLSESTSAEKLEQVERQLTSLSKSTAIQAVIATTAASSAASEASRLTALRCMAKAGLGETPTEWWPSLAVCLDSGASTLAKQAVQSARSLKRPKTPDPRPLESLRRLASNVGFTEDIRVEALDAAVGPGDSLTDEQFSLLAAKTDVGQSVSIRTFASSILSRAKLSVLQKEKLVESLSTLGPLEISRILAAFENGTEEILGSKIIGALAKSKAISALPPDTLRQRFAKMPEPVRRQAEALLVKLFADVPKQRERLEHLMSEVRNGDVRRGQMIFNSPKAACAACHAIGYLGGRLGPDLTSIGQVRTDQDLLEAIVYPSASFVRSYEPIVVHTRTGDEHSGVLRKDTAEEVLLATGPETEVRIARADVLEMRPGTVSVMPQGLDEQLSRQELADLMAFLKNTRWGAQ